MTHPTPSSAPHPTPAGPSRTTAAPALSARALTKTYGPTLALGGVGLDLFPGEAVAVMGASGSGKSTLLHCLAGVISPDSGSVVLDDPRHGRQDLSGLDAEERAAVRLRSFGFIFQQGLLLPDLTAVENVALPLLLGGTDRSAATARAAASMAALGLAGLEERRIGQLSGGQQQRVAIARAQVADPVVVFADEPTGALDSATSTEVMAALLASTRDRGRTLVVVTHDPGVAGTCDRVLHLSDGLVVREESLR
ncbi:ABC transporter ATP-binding protein [Ornithinimicrobium humiphilum]|uniref:Putative ABC transport system ATP-binding protein n=1 Tax=Ornithinimicrobium humiphilum TaxID=125288 RepID=A0A543KME0_9MICO|nr:ABC transporter ATP-binding protein [Ornithinimicrobium humiphilum]TQM96247.1 putative ABC transport system ATP-binding protein [Ornithinimicrobium humiphilum]